MVDLRGAAGTLKEVIRGLGGPAVGGIAGSRGARVGRRVAGGGGSGRRGAGRGLDVKRRGVRVQQLRGRCSRDGRPVQCGVRRAWKLAICTKDII